MAQRSVLATPALTAVALALFSLGSAGAQQTQGEWWPELDVYWTDHSGRYRLYGLASVTHTGDTGDRTGTLGLHVDYVSQSGFFLWPSGFYTRLGYQYIGALNGPSYHEQRVIAELTAATRIFALRLVNRTRVESRWIGGRPSQRFRYRVRVDHAFEIGGPWVVTPFAAFEPYYDTQYNALSRTGYRLGGEVARGGPMRVDLSYVRQDNRFTDVRHVNALALQVGLWYGGPKQGR